MAELRRLLIGSRRLEKLHSSDKTLMLNSNEVHYLSRVLRLRTGDQFAVVDGLGHLWKAHLCDKGLIRLSSSFACPVEEKSRPHPLIGLAIAVPKRGFEEVLRMSCEIGVDIVQPLSSERSVVRVEGESKSIRWSGIVREAIEQSERLWSPEFRSIIDVKDWLIHRPEKSAFAFASTRMLNSNEFQLWMNEMNQQIDQLWIAIGPEGGWTNQERVLAKKVGCVEVQFGDSILRTATAAVAATELMVSWRRNRSIYMQ